MVEGVNDFLETRDARNWKPLDGRYPIFGNPAETAEKVLTELKTEMSITVLLEHAYSPTDAPSVKPEPCTDLIVVFLAGGL